MGMGKIRCKRGIHGVGFSVCIGILGWGFWGWQGGLGCVVLCKCVKYVWGGICLSGQGVFVLW